MTRKNNIATDEEYVLSLRSKAASQTVLQDKLQKYFNTKYKKKLGLIEIVYDPDASDWVITTKDKTIRAELLESIPIKISELL